MSEKIIKLINKNDKSLDDKLELLEELYWANWSEINEQHRNKVIKIFQYLESDDLSIEEIAKVLPLYNNIEGAYTDRFAKIIGNFYKRDRIKFFKALNLNRDQASHLVYIFRYMGIIEDQEKVYEEIESTNQLTEEELDTAKSFFSIYKSICNT